MLLGLKQILAPMSLDAFFQTFWGKRAFSGQSEAISRLATQKDLLAAIRESHHDGVDLRGDLRGMMPRMGNEGGVDDFGTFLRHIHLDDLEALLDSGLNLNVRHAERFCPEVAALVKAIGDEVGSGTQTRADAFLHRHGGGGFANHFDSMSVLALQIAGSKTWWYQPHTSIAFPLTSAKADGWDSPKGLAHGEPPPTLPDPMERRVLHQGDWLFLPAGAWHRTEVEGPGLSIHVLFIHQRQWNWLADRCSERFGADSSWRALPVASEERLRDVLVRSVAELQTWLAELDSNKGP